MLAVTLVATPAPAAPMTLQQAVAFALGHSAVVLQAKAAEAAAAATLAKMRADNLPLVTAALQSEADKQSASNAGTFSQFGLQPSTTFTQNTAQLQGTHNLFNLVDIEGARRAKHAYDAAAANARLAREQTTLDVETSYYAMVQDQQLVTIAQGDVDYNLTLLQIADANFRGGRVAGIDRLKAQVQSLSSQERLASARADAEDARQNLAHLIGASIDQRFVVPPSIALPPPPTDLDVARLTQLALVQRPDVNAAQATYDGSVVANRLVDAPNRPNVLVRGAWGNQTSPYTEAQTYDNCIAQKARGNPAFANVACGGPQTHFFTIGVTASFTLPVEDYGTTHTAHTSARAAIDRDRQALFDAQQQARLDVDQAVRRFNVQRQNLALAAQSADVARQTAQIAQAQYRVGVIGQSDVTAAQQTYLQAAKDLLAAQIGYVLAVEKIKLATGAL